MLAATLALGLALGASARAQAPPLTDRLPADTLAYVYWRGAQSISPSSQNSLVALWEDPGFAPARQSIEEGLVGAMSRNPRMAGLPAQDVRALLAQPLVFGVRLPPPGSAAKPPTKAPSRLGVRVLGFLVVETTGEAAERLRAALVAAAPQIASHIRITSAGFLVASPDSATRDDLARRFGATQPPATDSLPSLAAYREARAELADRPAIEFFLRFPSVSGLHLPANPKFNAAAFLRALNLDRLHLFCGGIDLNSPTALLRFSLLGDTTPGSLFDLFGANSGGFDTLAAAPAGSSVTAFRIDFGAVVSVLSNALAAAMDPDQMARVKMIEGIISSSVLPSLAGEYATIHPPAAGPQTQGPTLFVAKIHSQAANQLFSTTLAPFLHPAGEEGEIRYYTAGAAPGGKVKPAETGDPAGQGGDTNQGKGVTVSGPQSLFIALTPHLLLASTDETLVRTSARAVTAASPPPGSLVADPTFRAARAELPAQLSALTYADFTRIPWAKLFQQVAGVSAKEKKSGPTAQAMAEFEKWARADAATVLARHLHWFVMGSWKDPSGVHWRGDIR